MIQIKTCYLFENGTLVFDGYVKPEDVNCLEVEEGIVEVVDNNVVHTFYVKEKEE